MPRTFTRSAGCPIPVPATHHIHLCLRTTTRLPLLAVVYYHATRTTFWFTHHTAHYWFILLVVAHTRFARHVRTTLPAVATAAYTFYGSPRLPRTHRTHGCAWTSTCAPTTLTHTTRTLPPQHTRTWFIRPQFCYHLSCLHAFYTFTHIPFTPLPSGLLRFGSPVVPSHTASPHTLPATRLTPHYAFTTTRILYRAPGSMVHTDCCLSQLHATPFAVPCCPLVWFGSHAPHMRTAHTHALFCSTWVTGPSLTRVTRYYSSATIHFTRGSHPHGCPHTPGLPRSRAPSTLRTLCRFAPCFHGLPHSGYLYTFKTIHTGFKFRTPAYYLLLRSRTSTVCLRARARAYRIRTLLRSHYTFTPHCLARSLLCTLPPHRACFAGRTSGCTTIVHLRRHAWFLVLCAVCTLRYALFTCRLFRLSTRSSAPRTRTFCGFYGHSTGAAGRPFTA